MQYYGAFYSTALHPLLKRINAYLLRWLRKNYKRLQGYKRAKRCWDGINPPGPWHVCPLAVEPCGLVIRRQEPGEPRGSRRGTAGAGGQPPGHPNRRYQRTASTMTSAGSGIRRRCSVQGQKGAAGEISCRQSRCLEVVQRTQQALSAN
jgi:Group II intron, maturase-specific domain